MLFRSSSLYFGVGEDFGIASSDLSSVLKLTRMLVPVFEGEFVEYTAESHALYRVRDGERVERAPTRSRTRSAARSTSTARTTATSRTATT